MSTTRSDGDDHISLDIKRVVDFQLYLLKTMDPPDHLLGVALDRLGHTREVMRDRYEVVSRLIRPVSGSGENLKRLLAGASVASAREAGDDKLLYLLPLWPNLYFDVYFINSGEYIRRAAFERKSSRTSAAGAAVWDFLKSDLNDKFEGVHAIDAWGHYESFTARDLGNGRQYFLRFCWGLLQEIEPLEGV